MKHLKTYESNKLDLSTGNYVVLQNYNNWLGDTYNCFKIKKFQDYHIIDVEYIDVRSNLIVDFGINIKDIDRMATEDEIEKYEILKDKIKYNL